MTFVACATALLGFALSAGLAGAGILEYTPGNGVSDSPHNMYKYILAKTGNPDPGNNKQQVCVYCHTPHNARTDLVYNPLWNHESTTQNFVPYFGTDQDGRALGLPPTTLNAQIDTATFMDGPSRLCMSCHDGATAVDSYGNINGNVTPDNPGTDGGINIAGASAYDPLTDTTGGSLMNDHPIGFNYSEVSAIDPKIRDKEEGLSNSYGNKIQRISDVLFKGDFFTCSTCHDVHNSPAKTATNQKYLLYATADSSKNCLICHKI
jgi:hypothetical protein